MRYAFITMISFFALAGIGMGEEIQNLLDVPPISASEFSFSNLVPEAHWIWTIIASEIVVIIAGFAWIQIANRMADNKYLKALTVIKDAVAACYQEYVRGIKEGKADGKLTIEEKNKALQMAYEKAIEFARSQGFDLLKIFAKETVLRLIEKYVGESKAKAVAAPLPDLLP